MERTHEHVNVDSAADPQAIQFAPPMKRPLSDNDPTRNVSPQQAGGRIALVGLVALALAVMCILTLLVFVDR